MEITISNLREDYLTVCETVCTLGDVVDVRGQVTRELTGVTLVLNNPYACTLPVRVNRGVNVKLAAVEALCLIGGTWRQDLVIKAAPHYADVLVSGDDETAANYAAYGPRVDGQLSTVIDQLSSDPTTRQALLQIWRAEDLTHVGDKPCTTSLQFMIRRNRLECHVSMRSNDVWLGLAIDVFVFTQLQHTLAKVLNLRAGKYVHHAGSLHAYERDWEKIDQLAVQPASWEMLDALPHGLSSPAPGKAAKAILAGRLAAVDPWYVNQMTKLYLPTDVLP